MTSIHRAPTTPSSSSAATAVSSTSKQSNMQMQSCSSLPGLSPTSPQGKLFAIGRRMEYSNNLKVICNSNFQWVEPLALRDEDELWGLDREASISGHNLVQCDRCGMLGEWTFFKHCHDLPTKWQLISQMALVRPC